MYFSIFQFLGLKLKNPSIIFKIMVGERVYNLWNSEKINTLFKEIDEYKKCGHSYIYAFKKVAEKLYVNPLTIRNLYYKKSKELGVKNRKINPFNKDEERWLFNSVNDLINKGFSIRGACKKLANHNSGLFLRYQNKYFKLKNKAMEENIVTMNIPNAGLSEEDINMLFKGVITLIKNNTAYEMDRKYKLIIDDYNERLNNVIMELNKKNLLLKKVLIENKELKCTKLTNVSKLQSLLKG